VLDGVLTSFFWDAAASSDQAVQLDADLQVLRQDEVGAWMAFARAVSPNGQVFVSTEVDFASGSRSLVLWRNDPDNNFPRLAELPLEGQLSGLAFDGTGETLYVVTYAPDHVLVVQ
jgi:hypothetical protein